MTLKNILKNKTFLLISAIILIFFIFYGRYVFLYFSQDDFFLLRVTRTDGSFLSLFKLLWFRPYEESGIYFYRPIFRELFFNTFFQLFGANPLPFRLFHFSLHIINIVLVYFVILKIFKQKKLALLSTFLFAIIAPNVGIVTYLAGGVTVSGMLMFSLISLIFRFKAFEEKKKIYKYFSYVFFILAICSHETGVMLPFVNLLLEIRKNGVNINNFKKNLAELIVYLIPVLLLFLAEVKIIGLPVSESGYGLSLSPLKLINSYFWYGLWGIGTPEMLLDYVGPGFKLNPNLLKYWSIYFYPIFLLLILIFSTTLFKFNKLIKNVDLWYLSIWFIVGLAPVVLLPFHRQTHYLEFTMPAISTILALLFFEIKKGNKKVAFIFLFSILTLSLVTINLTIITHWSIQRSKQAKTLIEDFYKKYPVLPKGSTVYFTNNLSDPFFNEEWGHSSKQASIILSGSDALQVLYNDPNIKVYYEDIGKPEKETPFVFQVNIKK